MEHEITDTKRIYEVWINSDLTEGRGFPICISVCEKESTARRLGKGSNVQGSDAQVKEGVALKIRNKWYAPCRIISPTKVDDEMDKIIQAKKAAREKAKKAGLTDEEIKDLTRTIQFK